MSAGKTEDMTQAEGHYPEKPHRTGRGGSLLPAAISVSAAGWMVPMERRVVPLMQKPTGTCWVSKLLFLAECPTCGWNQEKKKETAAQMFLLQTS